MKEHYIILSIRDIRSIIAGNKRQKRKMVQGVEADNCLPLGNGIYTHVLDATSHGLCPYGKPGDHLWVPEHWTLTDTGEVVYLATAEKGFKPIGRWKPAVTMPRSYARILLEITAVRVERLLCISEADAIAEGAARGKNGTVAKSRFKYWWSAAFGKKNWLANPWVWVIEFKQVGNEL
jgi:hypothetical protein